MRAALIAPDGTFEVEHVPDPVPRPADLVLRVTGCGVCATDLKARPAMPPGTVMGHELCGEVVAVGSAAAGAWKEGMRAAVLPVFSCGECQWCRSGDVAHCSGVSMIGLGGAPGGFSEYVRTSADLSFPLPASLPESWGPLVEPFAVGLHNAHVAGIAPGDNVLVVGGGAVGLTTTAWARRLGAGAVTVSDPHQNRRDAAGVFGATATVDPGADEITGPYDVVIECAGRPGVLDACAAVAETHGRVVVAGVCPEPDTFFQLVPLLKELSIRFSVYYRPDEFTTVVKAFENGEIDPSPLLTRTVALTDLDAAFESLTTSRDDLKVVVDPMEVRHV